MSFTCPRCGMTSHHPKDEEHGYCGACHDFTGTQPRSSAEISTHFVEMCLAHTYLRQGIEWLKNISPAAIPIELHKAEQILSRIEEESPARSSAASPETARLDRVDTALAKRLGDHIARDAKLRVKLNDWLKAYPLDVFPEPDFDKAADILMATGLSLDAISASNMRHVLTRIIAILGEN